jgi:hypothetical protein
MKLYNPFKPHIVEYDPNKFTIRRLPWYFVFSALDGNMWIYMDKYNDWYLNPYDALNSVEEAKQRLNYKKPAKFKPKVHTV